MLVMKKNLFSYICVVLAAIMAGRFMFGERGTLKRTLCALLIVFGILVATL